MFEFLRFGRGKKANKSQERLEPVNAQHNRSDIRIETARFALKSVLRRYGIPIHWIGAEIVPAANSRESGVLPIQLVVRQWHDEVMRYAPELQNQLSREIKFFDGTADLAEFQFVWKFMPDCGYTHEKIPDSATWAIATEPTPTPVAAALPATPVVVEPAKRAPVAKFDLPKSALDDQVQDDGFEATQIFERK
jgi:hypothetical protein